MPDLRERLDRKAARFEAPPEPLSRLRDRAAARDRRRRLATATVMIALVAGAGWIAFGAFRSTPRPADDPGRPTPVRPVVGETWRLPESGGEVVVADDGSVWGAGPKSLWRFDTGSERLERFPYPDGGLVAPLTFADGRLWGMQFESRTLVEIRPNGRVRPVTAIGSQDFVVRGGWIWVVEGGRLRRLGLDGSEAGSVNVPPEAHLPPELGGPHVWLQQGGSGLDEWTRFHRVDQATLELRETVSANGDLYPLAADGEGIWVASIGSASVARLDERVARRDWIELEAFLSDAVVAGGSLWAVGVDEQTENRSFLWQVDPDRNEVIGKRVRLGGRPQEIQAAGGSLWLADYSGNRPRVTRVDLAPATSEPDPGRRRVVARGRAFGKAWRLVVFRDEDGLWCRELRPDGAGACGGIRSDGPYVYPDDDITIGGDELVSGPVSRGAAAVELRLEDGRVLPARVHRLRDEGIPFDVFVVPVPDAVPGMVVALDGEGRIIAEFGLAPP